MLKNLFLTACIGAALTVPVSTQAQTAYIGLKTMPSSSSGFEGWNGRMFSFDLTDPATVTGEYCVIPTDESSMEDFYIKAGATVGDTYYAYVEGDFSAGNFRTLNFETNEIKTLSDNTAGFTVSDMTYDPVSGKLFALRRLSETSELYSVDLEDGSVERYDSITVAPLSAMAADGEGNIYAVSYVQQGELGAYTNNLTLYSYNVEGKTCTEQREVGTISGSILSTTMEYYEGKLYFVGNKNIAVIDPAAGELTLLDGQLPENSMAGLTFTKSTTLSSGGGGDEPVDPQPEDNGMRVKYEETWGSSMGDVPEDVASKRTIIWYDQYNNPVREARMGRNYDASGSGMSDEWTMMSYTKYDYDSNHRMISSHSEQYGQYSGEDFVFKSKNDTILYEYDDNGRLVKESDVAAGTYTVYEYDEEGQTTYQAKMMPDYYNQYGGEDYVMSSETYSDFVSFNQPKLIVGDGAYESYKFVTDVEYDENNHKVKATKWNADRSVKQTVEYWTWRNDSLVEYTLYKAKSDGNGGWTETGSKRLVYECVDGDPNKVREIGYSYDSTNGWAKNLYSNVTINGYYDAAYAPTDLKAEPVENDINTYELSFAAPSVPGFGEVSFDIYRHGFLIGNVKMSDEGAFDPNTGRITYIDKNVPNGSYDYMVQTIMSDEITGEEETYNVSNIVDVNPYVELPAATNLRVVNYDNSTGSDLVTVAWDAPDYDEDLMFQRYNVFITQLGMRAAENNAEDGQDTQYTLTFRFDEEDIFIQTVYHYGKVNSDTIHVNVHELTTSIGSVTQDVADGISINRNEIIVNGATASEITVFNAAGTKEATYRNTDRADISSLPGGVHIAFITINGKNTALKFSK